MQKRNSFVSRREKQGINMDFKVARWDGVWSSLVGGVPAHGRGLEHSDLLRSLQTKPSCDSVPAVEISDLGWMFFPEGWPKAAAAVPDHRHQQPCEDTGGATTENTPESPAAPSPAARPPSWA